MELMLKNVRLSYADLHKVGLPPKDRPNEPGKYGTQGIFAPGSEAHEAAKAALIAVAKAQWPDNWKAVIGGMDKDKKFLRNGDLNIDKKGAVKPEYKGMWYIKASNKNQPLLIGPKKDPRTGQFPVLSAASGKPYSGCYANVKIDVYASTQHGMAIHAQLLTVQFAADGQAFGGGAPGTADGFDEIEGADEADDFGSGDTSGPTDDDLGLG